MQIGEEIYEKLNATIHGNGDDLDRLLLFVHSGLGPERRERSNDKQRRENR